MIKVGIIGGENPTTGELLRLLLLHPEVDLITVYSPSLRGRALSSLHRGIIGDTEMRFSDALNVETLSVIFVTEPESITPGLALPEDVKVVYLQDDTIFDPKPPFDSLEYVPGVSEMFRKPLMRGARASRILPTPTSVALIALFPLALHLLLNDTLSISVRLPKYKNIRVKKEEMKKELESILNKVQLSFTKIRDIDFQNSDLLRAIEVDITLACNVSEDEIERIYSETYDDHNFTYLMRNDPSATEVAGTQKCILSISKPESSLLKVRAVADSFLRGGAGDAIHAMNLLFGLYEKTGLSFPASMAFRQEEIDHP